MPGFVVDQGRTGILALWLARNQIDRDADLRLGLFTNVTYDNTLLLAAITEPVGTDYARQVLSDGAWVITAVASYAERLFTAGVGGWAGEVQGYFLASVAAGGTPRLHAIEPDKYQVLAAGAMTRAGATVTVNSPLVHNLLTGDRVNVRNAVQPEYNGIQVITVVDPDTFTFTLLTTPASPATGAITINRSSIMNAGDTYRVTPNITIP